MQAKELVKNQRQKQKKVMILEEAKMAFEQLKAQGETDKSILAVLYGMFAEDTIELDELESLIGVLGYEFSEEFKNMSPEDQ